MCRTQNMDLSGSLDVSGNTTIGGALQANGGITCDTDKFVVEDATGNTSIGGTLVVETSLTTNQLIVNDDLYFDTIVIRRPTGITGITDDFSIGLKELQVWINGSNLLVENSATLTSYFADWSVDKYVDTGARVVIEDTLISSNSYNNIIETDSTGSLSLSSASDTALIITDIPLTKINDIQALILYNRTAFTSGGRAIGLIYELYNKTNDPDLIIPLATTNEITTAEDVYRYDFPAIDAYPSGDFSDTNSTTQIASETLALKEVVSEFVDSANITGGLKVDTITTTGNVDISGNLLLQVI